MERTGHQCGGASKLGAGPPFTTTLGEQIGVTAKPTTERPPTSRPDTLGLGLVAVLVALVVTAWAFGMSTETPHPPGPGPVFMGLFLLALGAMFLASYFYSAKSFFLRWLLHFAMAFPGMNSPKMAWLMAFVSALAGLGAIAQGMGLRLL